MVPEGDGIHYFKDFEKCVGLEKEYSEIQMVVDSEVLETAEEVQAIRDCY
jgi:hypothetical protein